MASAAQKSRYCRFLTIRAPVVSWAILGLNAITAVAAVFAVVKAALVSVSFASGTI